MRQAGTAVGIAFILPDLGGGGAQRVMLRFAGALDPQRYAVTVISLGDARAAGHAIAPHVEIRSGGHARVRSALPWLWRELDRLRPRAVVSVMGYLNLALLALKPLLPGRPRLVVREANMLEPTLDALPRWVPGRLLYRTLYPRADLVVAPSRRIADALLSEAPGCSSVLTVISNPVDEASLRASAGAMVPHRPPTLRLVSAGRLTRQKGFDRLLDTFAGLPRDATLSIFGEGPERGMLEAQVAALDLSARVEFPGYSNALPAAIAHADAFVLSSRWEGLPNVALEALALGTPVVATPECGLDEVAAAAPPGAVTVAEAGFPLAQALAALQASRERDAPRPSLLPPSYGVEHACSRFAAALEDILRS